MVARLLGRLLETYEQHTGEDFEGQEVRAGQGGAGQGPCAVLVVTPRALTLLLLAPSLAWPALQHQYDQLFALAQRALGSSVPKSLLKSAVRAYLGI